MPVDARMGGMTYYPTDEADFTGNVILERQPYKRPETCQEKEIRLKQEKRRARARRNQNTLY